MSFKSIHGQGRVLAQLEALLKGANVPHAMVFVGPSGIGKRSVALAFSKALLATDSSRAEIHAKKIDAQNHPDVSVVSALGQSILMTDVRKVLANAVLKPYEASVKVIIIDEAERLTLDAQNALLKILEEPPKNVFFILVVGDADRLLATVRSRCQRFLFQSLRHQDIKAILTAQGFPPNEVEQLTRLANGSLEYIATDAEKLSEMKEHLWNYLLGEPKGEYPDWSGIAKDDLLFLLDVLAELFRDALVGRHAPSLIQGRMDVERIQTLAARYSSEEAQNILEAIAEAREAITKSLNPKLVNLKLWSQIGAQCV